MAKGEITLDVNVKTKFSWSYFLTKVTSRKFIAALAVEVAGLVALFDPQVADVTNEIIVRVGALAAMVTVALGYVVSEASIDKAAAKAAASASANETRIAK